MLSFECDYAEGAHEKILKAFIDTNTEQLQNYGGDIYSARAKEKIKKAFGAPNADVYFLTGGTQTNQIVIDSMLKSYEGVISAQTGHIGCHEAGAIEYSGHKVLTLPEHMGKIDANELSDYLAAFFADNNHEHMVFPGMVYISHPTEYGTLYAKDELKAIYNICKRYGILLFMDGARLGYGLASYATDLTPQDIAENTDIFYIGGTKVGALCGEAVVFSNVKIPAHFVTIVKQHGALLAKGRLLGIQFDTLFTDNLYFEISKNAIEKAEILKEVLKKHGCRFYIDSPTNQQFVIIDNDKLTELAKYVRYSFWEKYDEKSTVVRFATSWCTTVEAINKLDEILGNVLDK